LIDAVACLIRTQDSITRPKLPRSKYLSIDVSGKKNYRKSQGEKSVGIVFLHQGIDGGIGLLGFCNAFFAELEAPLFIWFIDLASFVLLVTIMLDFLTLIFDQGEAEGGR
jgi:hypothetical protein